MSDLRIVVLGLGNLMRTDDAVGMMAVERLRADERVPSSASLVDGGTLGLDLLHPLEGATHVLALDAIESGATPGTLLCFAGQDIENLPVSKSVHLLGFSDLIGAMRLTGNAPVEIVVLGVQPEATGWGTQLTPVVQRALPRLVEAALDQMARWQAAMPGAPPDRYTEQIQASAVAG